VVDGTADQAEQPVAGAEAAVGDQRVQLSNHHRQARAQLPFRLGKLARRSGRVAPIGPRRQAACRPQRLGRVLGDLRNAAIMPSSSCTMTWLPIPLEVPALTSIMAPTSDMTWRCRLPFRWRWSDLN
jgi:hypothetical protein